MAAMAKDMSRTSALERQRDAATRKLSEALSLIRRLQRDKKRLDFLTNMVHRGKKGNGIFWGVYGMGINMTLDKDSHGWIGHGKTPREAIDAAMVAERKARRKA